jgi:hypothetical protein
MKATTLLAAAALLLLSMSVDAQNAQQEKMTTCNTQAKAQSLSGDARKSFMSTCLSNQPAAAPKLNSQHGSQDLHEHLSAGLRRPVIIAGWLRKLATSR